MFNLSPKGQRRIRTHCRNGHSISESRLTPKGYLRCKSCEKRGRNKYYKAHPERNKINALNDRRLRKEKRQDIITFLGGKCKVCGIDDERVLQIDHVNGGGTKESKILSYVGARYKRIKINPKEYQLLCANHNAIKIWEKEERITKY